MAAVMTDHHQQDHAHARPPPNCAPGRPQQHTHQQHRDYAQRLAQQHFNYYASLQSSSQSPSSSKDLYNTNTMVAPMKEAVKRIPASHLMLLIAAGQTLAGVLGFSSAAQLMDAPDDELEDEAQSDLIQVVVIFARVWLLASAVVGVLAARGIVQSHLPTLRIFATHALIDTVLTALVVALFGVAAFSGSVSSSLGHAVCEHLSRGDAWGLVASPGSGLELCEERWTYGLAPSLLLLGGIALFVRCKTAAYVYDYYRRSATEGRISLESPESSAMRISSSSSSRASRDSYDLHRHHHQQQQQHQQPYHHVARRSSSEHAHDPALHHGPTTHTRARTNTGSSKHSRSSSSSTVRPHRAATASRIMLLPPDYSHQGQHSLSSPITADDSRPSLRVTPPSPNPNAFLSANSSSDSIDTVRATSTSSSTSTNARKRSMSHDSGSADSCSHHVIVYAPVLMSIEEAQQLGGREAVIASASSTTTSSMVASPTTYTSPRLRHHSPPSMQQAHHHHPVHEKGGSMNPVSVAQRRSDSNGTTTTTAGERTPTIPPSHATGAFGSIKGYRDETELDSFGSSNKLL